MNYQDLRDGRVRHNTFRDWVPVLIGAALFIYYCISYWMEGSR